MRRRVVALVAASVVPAFAAPALAALPSDDVPRPTGTVLPTPDYVAPLVAPDGSPASLPPLAPAVTVASRDDQQLLRYLQQDDLGGFRTAPVGQSLTSGGAAVVGQQVQQQLPRFGVKADGAVTSFGGVPLPGVNLDQPDNGFQPVPGLGVPPPAPVPTPAVTQSPGSESGFGPPGPPSPAASPTSSPGGGSRTPAPPPKPSPTSTAAAPSRAPSVTPTPTRSASPSPAPSTHPPSGTPTPSLTAPPPTPAPTPTVSFVMTNDRNGQPVVIGDRVVPGQTVTGVVVIGNAGSVPFTYTVRAAGSAASPLWSVLQLTVVDGASGRVIVDHRPLSDPPRQVAALAPGERQRLLVQLTLPAWVGNAYQGKSLTLTFVWHASG